MACPLLDGSAMKNSFRDPKDRQTGLKGGDGKMKSLLVISMVLLLAIVLGGCATRGDLEKVQAQEIQNRAKAEQAAQDAQAAKTAADAATVRADAATARADDALKAAEQREKLADEKATLADERARLADEKARLADEKAQRADAMFQKSMRK